MFGNRGTVVVRHLTHEEIFRATSALTSQLARMFPEPGFIKVCPVPRGGIPAAYALKAHHPGMMLTTNPREADFILDDLVDSGETQKRYAVKYPEKHFAALFAKFDKTTPPTRMPFSYGECLPKGEWVVFPWEHSEQKSAEDIIIRLLQYIGEDPSRGGLKETPGRVIKAWREEWASGYNKDPALVLKAFEDGGENYDEMILVRDIPVYTHCEHHIAPFFGVAHIGYIPNGRIVGLSKLVRLTDIFARRLQVQERLTAQIAEAIMEHMKPKGVGVVLKCRHLCMESRGVCKAGTLTTTSKLLGAMFDKPEARSEFFSLIGRNGV